MIEINYDMEWIPLKNVKGVSGFFTGTVDEINPWCGGICSHSYHWACLLHSILGSTTQ